MKIRALQIFPVKSIAGISVDVATTAARGFVGDRRYMVVDADGRFMTQRRHPKLGHVRGNSDGRGWRLERPDGATVRIEPPEDGANVDVEIWGDRVTAASVSAAADDFFSELLSIDARLVYMPDGADRDVDGDPVSFADGYPYLVTVVASLDDLNARIEGPAVPMEAFRPNIVVEGADAWAEDEWDELSIGSVRFRVTTPCVRCKVTTLDPDAPDRPRRDNEPLRTLATFRRAGGGVTFGVNAVCRTTDAVVRVGDAVEVSRR